MNEGYEGEEYKTESPLSERHQTMKPRFKLNARLDRALYKHRHRISLFGSIIYTSISIAINGKKSVIHPVLDLAFLAAVFYLTTLWIISGTEAAKEKNKELAEAKLRRDEHVRRKAQLLDEELARHKEHVRRETQLRHEEQLRREEQDRRKAQLRYEEQARLRDGDTQDRPYIYQIGRHANETLALRYGIANMECRAEGKRGQYGRDADQIKLQKVRRAGMKLPYGEFETRETNTYLVKLTDFRNRAALAVIEPGTEYVKTFLPRHKAWFDLNKHIEETLKGNATMTLKEIASYHIMKGRIPD